MSYGYEDRISAKQATNWLSFNGFDDPTIRELQIPASAVSIIEDVHEATGEYFNEPVVMARWKSPNFAIVT